MTKETKLTIIAALRNYRGDDYYRALLAFDGLPEPMMDLQYGNSGKTRREILEECKRHMDAVDAAFREVENL